MTQEKQNAKTPRRRGAKRGEPERESLRSEAPSLQRVPRIQENSSAEGVHFAPPLLLIFSQVREDAKQRREKRKINRAVERDAGKQESGVQEALS